MFAFKVCGLCVVCIDKIPNLLNVDDVCFRLEHTNIIRRNIFWKEWEEDEIKMDQCSSTVLDSFEGSSTLLRHVIFSYQHKSKWMKLVCLSDETVSSHTYIIRFIRNLCLSLHSIDNKLTHTHTLTPRDISWHFHAFFAIVLVFVYIFYFCFLWILSVSGKFVSPHWTHMSWAYTANTRWLTDTHDHWYVLHFVTCRNTTHNTQRVFSICIEPVWNVKILLMTTQPMSFDEDIDEREHAEDKTSEL